ncbi:Protein of unknown function, partial [Cotesia congregata]
YPTISNTSSYGNGIAFLSDEIFFKFSRCLNLSLAFFILDGMDNELAVHHRYPGSLSTYPSIQDLQYLTEYLELNNNFHFQQRTSAMFDLYSL